MREQYKDSIHRATLTQGCHYNYKKNVQLLNWNWTELNWTTTLLASYSAHQKLTETAGRVRLVLLFLCLDLVAANDMCSNMTCAMHVCMTTVSIRRSPTVPAMDGRAPPN